jgi:F-type H+-transporting ATPase subunit b
MENVGTVAWIITHALAFLALFWFLRRVAWRPILDLLDQRSESIEKQYAEMERMKAEAERSQQENKAQLQAAYAEARDLVQKAKADAEKLKEQLQSENHAQIEKARKEATERIAHETEVARAELRRYVADLSIAVAEKFLIEGLTDQQKKQLTDRTLPEIENAASRN